MASGSGDEVIEVGEHLPGMAALWDVATVEERYEMVTIILESGGLYYDLEHKVIVAIKSRPAQPAHALGTRDAHLAHDLPTGHQSR